MPTLTPTQLATIESAAGWLGVELRLDYSGRGMYGNTCLGVVGDYACAKDLVDKIYEYAEEDDDDDLFALADLMSEDWSRDSMGLKVIEYWSFLSVEGRCDTEDSEVE